MINPDRQIKSEYIYLHPHTSATDMRKGLKWWIDYYNIARPHSVIGDMNPRQCYQSNLPSAA
ncbi:MAG: transposase [Bacteroides sp.]|nr:transposase [Bacteroides sp.]